MMDAVDSSTTIRLDGSPPSSTFDEPAIATGRTIGRYVVLEELGRGAMGIVYAAFDPELDRKVAIKLLHATGASTDEAREELLLEAQAIAKISHPNVIAVHDVGMFEDRVFMAMEFLGGGTLRSFIERTRPGWRVVLQCFLAAGRGLAAAHALGMVHRDFKPDNIFIDDGGAAGTGACDRTRAPASIRVGDFGLARAEQTPTTVVAPRLVVATSNARRTLHDCIAGSPAYMSPEQYESAEVDARSDQFSFCVALYEMLYAQGPFDGGTGRQVRELKRAGKIAAAPRHSDVPGWVRRALEQGLSADRAQRHASMAALVRVLEADPAAARRTWYLAAGAAVVLAAGGSMSYRAYRQAVGICMGGEHKLVGIWDEDARREVRAGLARADDAVSIDVAARVELALDGYTEDWRAMHRSVCEATRLRGEQSEALLDRRMDCLGDRLRDLHALVGVYRDADRNVTMRALDAAYGLPGLDACADIEALGSELAVPSPEDQPAVAAADDRLAHARALLMTGRVQDARSELDAIAADAELLAYAPLSADSWLARGRWAESAGEFGAAQDAYREAIASANAVKYDDVVARAAIGMVTSSARSAQLGEATTALRFAESAVDRVGAPRGLAIALLDGRGTLQHIQGDYEGALHSHRGALALEEAASAPQAAQIAAHWHSIASVYLARGELDAALTALRRVYDVRVEIYGASHPAVADVAAQISNVQRKQGHLAEAQASIEQALATRMQAFGAESTPVAEALNQLATVQADRGEWEQAQAQFERARVVLAAVLGPTHPAVANALNNLAMCEHHRHDLGASAAYMDQAYAIYVTAYGPRHPLIANALGNMAELAQERGELLQAADLAGRSVEMFRAIDHGQSSYFPPVLALLGDLERMQGRAERARASYREVLAIAGRTHGVDQDTFAQAWCGLDRLAVTPAERPRAPSTGSIDCASIARDGA
jgi:eukaryotic-like serine/threonine-protein kinase